MNVPVQTMAVKSCVKIQMAVTTAFVQKAINLNQIKNLVAKVNL